MAFESLADRLAGAFKRLRSKGKLTQQDVKESMREIRTALLEADVNYKVAKELVANISERAVGSEVMQSLTPAQQVVKIVNEELVALMGGEAAHLKTASRIPTIIMMCGLQGSGKTTHSCKLAYMLKKQGKRPIVAACDVYRPAAILQLQLLAEKAGVPCFEMGNANPVDVAKAAVAHARDHGNDYLILDTAGRLQIDEQLMTELENIGKAVQPTDILLVVDSMMGQEAVNVANTFNERLEIDGVILTKLDGDTRGGAAVSVKAVTGKPILYSGTGEKLDDLEPFYPDRMASRILGMGDVLTFIERAQEQIDEQKALELEKKLKKNKFDLNDLLDQFRQLSKMGSFEQLLSMIPGVGGKLGDIDIEDTQIKRFEAIILSMTTREREKPDIINPSRKRRIAAGSGVEVQDVNRLLKQFRDMQKMMKQFSGPAGKKAMNMGRMPPGFKM